jgi:hypothetical protein
MPGRTGSSSRCRSCLGSPGITTASGGTHPAQVRGDFRLLAATNPKTSDALARRARRRACRLLWPNRVCHPCHVYATASSQRTHRCERHVAGRDYASESTRFCRTHRHASLQVSGHGYRVGVGGSRFLEVDPIEGGSANDYDYVNSDPTNGYDIAGTCGVFGNPLRPCGRGHRGASSLGNWLGQHTQGARQTLGRVGRDYINSWLRPSGWLAYGAGVVAGIGCALAVAPATGGLGVLACFAVAHVASHTVGNWIHEHSSIDRGAPQLGSRRRI